MEGYHCNFLNWDSEEISVPPEAFQRGFEPIPPLYFDESSCYPLRHSQESYAFNDRQFAAHLEPSFLNHEFNFNLDSYLSITTPKTLGLDSYQPQFKKELDSEQNLDQERSNEANYHRGHIDFLRQLATPIFLQSRKYWKSKRKMQRGKTYYKFVAKHMKAEQGKSCKRFDQYYLQQSFKKLGVREQEEREATLEAIRHLKKYQDNPQNRKLLEKHREKYQANRKWAVFLDEFVNSDL